MTISLAARPYGGGHAVCIRQGGGRVTVLDPVVFRFALRRVTRQAAFLAQGGEISASPRDELVYVRLVTRIPEDHVARGLEDTVQGERQLNDAEVGAEMSAGRGDCVDDECPDLVCESRQFLGAQTAKVSWAVYSFEEHDRLFVGSWSTRW